MDNVFDGVSCAMGGNIKGEITVNKAIREFVDREYPNNELTNGLTVIPDLPTLDVFTTRHIYSSHGAKGGLLDPDSKSLLHK